MATVKKQVHKKPTDPYRRSLYGKIEIAKKSIGMDDDTYRDLLEVRYGKRSRKQLGNRQLVDLVEHFKTLGFKPKRKAPARAGSRPMASGKTQRKIRALWITLYHLGIITDSSEKALAAFVKRQAGVDDLRFLIPEKAFKVIEALKSWATRDGGVNWRAYASTNGPFYKPRCRVMEAQWEKLHDLGVVKIRDHGALSSWVGRFVKSPGIIPYLHLDDHDADLVIEALGQKIRKATIERKKNAQRDD